MALAGGSGNRVAVTDFGYEDGGRLNALSHDLATAGTPEIIYALGYDRANRLTSLTNSAHASENVTSYAYDDKDQLTDVNYASITDENYDYDANGNRETANGNTYYTGAGNQISSDDGTSEYVYDSEGNVFQIFATDGSFTQYKYDHHNRLTEATVLNAGTGTTKKVRYTYDAFDRLVKRELDTTSLYNYGDAVVEYFAMDGPDIALKWVDPDGTGGTAPALDRRYLNGPATDQILAEETEGNAVSWMVQDRQGSVTEILDNTGSVVDHIFYDGYGNETESVPTAHTNGYAGYFRDIVTKLLRSETRWYGPSIGRWIQEDPIGFNGVDKNLSRYVGNGPTIHTDSSGLLPDDSATNDLLEPKKILTQGPIKVTWGVDAARGKKYNDFPYKVHTVADPKSWVGAYIKVEDLDKGKPCGQCVAGTRVWASAKIYVKENLYGNGDSTDMIKDRNDVQGQWLADRSTYEPTTKTYWDFPGFDLAELDAPFRAIPGLEKLRRSGYAVAILCKVGNKLDPKPIAELYFTVEWNVTKTETTVSIGMDTWYQKYGRVKDWTTLK